MRGNVFKLSDRGFKDTIVLLPGWAADHRIFGVLNLDYNYLMPAGRDFFDFREELLEFLDRGAIGKISLFGWSQGGFLAAEFASRHPDRVEELVLIGIRKRFDREALEGVERRLTKNKKIYLYKFYLESFSGEDKEGLAWFKKNLLKSYLQDMETEDLIRGLDCLSRATIDPERLRRVEKIRIFHGTEDAIAPFKEAEEIGSRLPQAQFIPIAGAGHCPFLRRDFREIFYHCCPNYRHCEEGAKRLTKQS